MSRFSDEEIYDELGKIVEPFPLLECAACAAAVLRWLADNEVSGQLIRIKTKYKEEFILSSRLDAAGITESITRNGVHYGVEIRGRVFDNLSTEGLPKEDWINDFSCRRGEFIIEELDHF